MRSLTATGLRIERLAKQQDGQSIGATIATILLRKEPWPRLTDEVLAQSRTGRLLLQRRQRAGLTDQG
jgi:hypothetical protein